MQIDQTSFFLPGNVYARSAVFRATSADAAGQTIEPQAIRRLGRAMGFMRPAILDFSGWRRLRRSQTAVPAAAVAEAVAVIVQRYVNWPVAYCAWRPADNPGEGEAAAGTGAEPETESEAEAEAAAPESRRRRPEEASGAETGTEAEAETEAAAPALQPASQQGARQAQGTAIFQAVDPQIGQHAAQAGFAVVQALVEGIPAADLRKAVRRALRRFLSRTLPATPSGDALLLAGMAASRGIPWQVVTGSTYVRIGLGPHARIVKGTESSLTSSISVKLAGDKSLANRLLIEAGLPVPRQITARNADAAVAAAGELGYPLVVKPYDGKMGRDITIGVTDEAGMRAAFARAVSSSDRAVIETLIPGEEMRLLIAGGRMLSVSKRQPAQVWGDGTRSVADLVREENRRPERDQLLTGSYALMKPIQLDDDALALLAQQGLTVESVPEEGRQVFLRRESNISRGGSPVDVTDQVHPSIVRAAEGAARALRLEVCGVDFVTTDPSRPWKETGGAICEVNSRPGLQGQMMAAPEDRREAILEATFNALLGEDERRGENRARGGGNGRAQNGAQGGAQAGGGLPVVALIGTADTTRRLRQALEGLAQRAGRKLGIVGEATRLAPSSVPLETAAGLFQAGDIDAAVIALTPRDLLASGLGLPRIAAAVMSPDLGKRTETVRKLLERVSRGAVSTADDPAALERAAAALGLPTDALASSWPAAAASKPISPEPDDNPMHNGAYTILFVGDVGFGESYLHYSRAAALREVLASHGHGHSISNLLGLLQSADHVIGNLEVPLADSPDPALEGRKNFLGWCDADRTVAALREAGFDALSLANNHVLDCGTAGLAETMRRLADAGIEHFGAGPTRDDALRPYVHQFSAGGTRRTLVVFGGFEYRARYARRFRWYASPNMAGVGMISPRRIGEWIASNGSSLTNPTYVAFPHWGTDYEGVTETQRSTAAELVEQGIDLIIGHGAHVAQPVEIVGGKTVVFNVGNFIWNTPGRFVRNGAPPYGVAAALRFDEDNPSVPTLNLYPLMIDNSVTNFQSRPVTGSEVEPSLQVLAHALADRPLAASDGVGHHLRLVI